MAYPMVSVGSSRAETSVLFIIVSPRFFCLAIASVTGLVSPLPIRRIVLFLLCNTPVSSFEASSQRANELVRHIPLLVMTR